MAPGGIDLVRLIDCVDSLFMAAPCWRVSPGASYHSFTTSSEEPPLSNFNSYWDIPPEVRLHGHRGIYSLSGLHVCSFEQPSWRSAGYHVCHHRGDIHLLVSVQ